MSLLDRLSVAAAKMAAVVLMVSLLAVVTSAVGGVVGGARQSSVQRGIDAHTVQVTARSYVLSYVFEDQEYQAPHRERARICGTRGSYDGAATRLAWLAGLFVFVAVVGVAAARAPLMTGKAPPSVPEQPRHWLARITDDAAKRRPTRRRPRRRPRR